MFSLLPALERHRVDGTPGGGACWPATPKTLPGNRDMPLELGGKYQSGVEGWKGGVKVLVLSVVSARFR